GFAPKTVTVESRAWSSIELHDLDDDRDLDVFLGVNSGQPSLNLANEKILVVEESIWQGGSVPAPRAGGLAVQADIGGPLFPRMLIFGGDSDIGPTNDLYALRLTDHVWETVCTISPCSDGLPTPRLGVAGSWNASMRVLLVFGEMSATPDDTLYMFDPTSETWNPYM